MRVHVQTNLKVAEDQEMEIKNYRRVSHVGVTGVFEMIGSLSQVSAATTSLKLCAMHCATYQYNCLRQYQEYN